ncbi:MAG: hypothetical protein JWN15_976 [Firmicutes bacterium]|nr:hypothetical protein [Bacillota bacterium]
MSVPADQIRTDRVAIYIRWSTEDQGEGTTLDVQMDACKGYIVSQGWTFRDDLVFVDDGISGATMERPALGRLRGLVRQRQVDCVVVFKLDRLSRSVLDMVKLVLEEWDGLCSIKSAREPIDTLSPTGKMFFYQLMSFAEWERSVIRDRMTSGRLRRAQQGRFPGGSIPYGYAKTDDGRMAVLPAEAAVVAWIFRLYLGGLGCRAISKQLDQEGHSSPTGGKWAQPTLGRILANQAYIGRFVYGKRRVRNGKKVAAAEPLVVTEGFFPPLVSREEFEAVQRLRAERPGVGRNHGTGRTLGSQSLLSGLLKCSCGRSLSGIGFEARGISYRYYACGGAQTTGAHVCNSGNIRQGLLDNVVVEQMLALFRGETARKRLLEHLSRNVKARHLALVLVRDAAQAELKRLEDSERRIKALFIDGKLSLEEYRELLAELHTRLAEARKKVREAAEAMEGALASVNQQVRTTLLLDRINEWEQLTHPEQKQLLRHFISHIVAHRDKQSGEITCEVVWNWDGGVEQREPVQVIRQERGTARTKAAAAGRKRVAGRFAAAD